MTGTMIEMTAHMVDRPETLALILCGAALTVIGGTIGIIFGWRKRWRVFWPMLALSLIGLGLLTAGANQPRVKELKFCANGPVSLEQIAVLYDIRDVDGKLITLWER